MIYTIAITSLRKKPLLGLANLAGVYQFNLVVLPAVACATKTGVTSHQLENCVHCLPW